MLTDVTQCGMTSRSVIEDLDALKDTTASLLHSLVILRIDQLHFQTTEERFITALSQQFPFRLMLLRSP